ncbi:MAG: hypothetical protein HRU07_06895 [Nitrosopumilus sp.]|nr:hypothetical protein [Nitrosopumilus sp.]NRA05866.1 hypothetical protein [Nitrosopumilus sp.]
MYFVLLNNGSHKLGDFKSYHSLAPKAQEVKKPIFELSGSEIVGVQNDSVAKCDEDFKGLAQKIIKHIQ